MQPTQTNIYKSFAAFYPFYLSEHRNPICRRLHFLGSSLSLVCLGLAIALGDWRFLVAMLLMGYGFAWIGHFAFEKTNRHRSNSPCTVSWAIG